MILWASVFMVDGNLACLKHNFNPLNNLGMKIVVMSIAKRITKARIDAGLKKSQLAKLAGVTPSSVTQWETGETKSIDGRNLVKIAAACGVDAVWLATGQNLPVHVGNEISTTSNIPKAANLSPDLLQVIAWYQGMGPRNQQRAQAQLKLWFLDDNQEDERPSVPGARVISQGEALEPNQKGHHKSNRKAAK